MVNEKDETQPGAEPQPPSVPEAEAPQPPASEAPEQPETPASEAPSPASEAPVPAGTEEASPESLEPPETPEPPETTEQPLERPTPQPTGAAPLPEAAGLEPYPGLTLGAGPAAEIAAPEYTPVIRGKLDRFGVAMGTGRRKTAVARVRVKDGNGAMTINGRTLEEYFRTERDREMIQAPLRSTDRLGKVDVWVRVDGGGTTGQTGAIVLGIARALEAMDSSLHPLLSEGGYLTRDERMVERKKYGFKKARRSFQFSKR